MSLSVEIKSKGDSTTHSATMIIKDSDGNRIGNVVVRLSDKTMNATALASAIESEINSEQS